MLTAMEATALAERVKRSTRNPDILDLCDCILHRSPLVRPSPAPPVPPPPKRVRQKTEQQKLRDAETAKERMRKMRAKSRVV